MNINFKLSNQQVIYILIIILLLSLLFSCNNSGVVEGFDDDMDLEQMQELIKTTQELIKKVLNEIESTKDNDNRLSISSITNNDDDEGFLINNMHDFANNLSSIYYNLYKLSRPIQKIEEDKIKENDFVAIPGTEIPNTPTRFKDAMYQMDTILQNINNKNSKNSTIEMIERKNLIFYLNHITNPLLNKLLRQTEEQLTQQQMQDKIKQTNKTVNKIYDILSYDNQYDDNQYDEAYNPYSNQYQEQDEYQAQDQEQDEYQGQDQAQGQVQGQRTKVNVNVDNRANASTTTEQQVSTAQQQGQQVNSNGLLPTLQRGAADLFGVFTPPSVLNPAVNIIDTRNRNQQQNQQPSLPDGNEFIRRSKIVPPVCPACPPVIVDKNTLNQECPPCPPCARCPEPSFECQKVPNFSAGPQNNFLPRPVLNDFSTFGM